MANQSTKQGSDKTEPKHMAPNRAERQQEESPFCETTMFMWNVISMNTKKNKNKHRKQLRAFLTFHHVTILELILEKNYPTKQEAKNVKTSP